VHRNFERGEEVSTSFKKTSMLLLAIGLFSSTFSATAEIKLQLNYSTIISYSSGTIENGNGVAIVEIDDQMPDWLYIRTAAPGTINNVSVSTGTTSNSKPLENLSNRNKWDLSNATTGTVKSIRDRMTRVSIDRNTEGLIVQESKNIFDGGFMLTTSSGNCVKVNNQTRKF